jgi:hypothetical protein
VRLNHGSSALKPSSLHLNYVRRMYRFEALTTYLARSLGADFIPFNSEMVVPVNRSIATTLAVKLIGSMRAEGGCGYLIST